MKGWLILSVALALAFGFVLREWKVHAFHRRVLIRIRQHPGIKASEVATTMGADQLSVRCSVGWLENAGKVTTLPESGDRRCWPVHRA